MILFLLYSTSTSTRTTIAHQYELQYCTTVQYNRAGGVSVFTRRVLKRGVRGGFPPWLGRGGGFEEPKVPPPLILQTTTYYTQYSRHALLEKRCLNMPLNLKLQWGMPFPAHLLIRTAYVFTQPACTSMRRGRTRIQFEVVVLVPCCTLSIGYTYEYSYWICYFTNKVKPHEAYVLVLVLGLP